MRISQGVVKICSFSNLVASENETRVLPLAMCCLSACGARQHTNDAWWVNSVKFMSWPWMEDWPAIVAEGLTGVLSFVTTIGVWGCYWK
jgi:hypothetical protein